MSRIHRSLTQEKWNGLDQSSQILSMASELQRACKRADISAEEARLSLERVMELVDVTVEDRDKWHGGRLRELLRLREVLAEFYLSEKPDSSGMKKALRVLLNFDPAGSTLNI